PTPEPDPTPTSAFASEEESFAAAEETYRAYTEALNRQRAGEDGPDPLDSLTGLALEDHLHSQAELDRDSISIDGETVLISFVRELADLTSDATKLTAVVCLDISSTGDLDEAGTDITPVERPGTAALKVEFVWNDILLTSRSVVAVEIEC